MKKGVLKPRTPRVQSVRNLSVTAVVSRLLAVDSDAASVPPAPAPPAACAVFPALHVVSPQEEVLHVRSAVARLGEELATAEQAHSG